MKEWDFMKNRHGQLKRQENEILAVSFGTAFKNSRIKDIKGIEDALKQAYPDWSVRRAFTAQTIINHIRECDGENSWKSRLVDSNLKVKVLLSGLGGIRKIQELYVAHTALAMNSLYSS